ncbi:MAG: glycosyltransferase family 2 protein [bacterium]
MSKKLSIVIPAYNEELYLGECIEAVLSCITDNNMNDIEVIVVNNASTDATEKIAKSYLEVILVNELKKGLTNARQAGYLASTGELIANIDADTLMAQGWIEKVLAEFENNKKLVALSGPYIYYDKSAIFNTGVWLYYLVGYYIHLVNQYVFRIGAMLQGGNFVLRRSALEKIGGYNLAVQFYGEDTDIASRIFKIGDVKFLFTLPMRTSGRRLSQEGVVKTAYKYIINFLSIILLHKPAKATKYSFVGNKIDEKK